MTTQEIANRLTELMRTGKWLEAQEELFSDDIVSVEPDGGTVQGRQALAKKAQDWNEMVEDVGPTEISEALVADSYIACTLKGKMKLRGSGEEIPMDELCIYHTEGGKIVKEQFFYTPKPEFA